MLYRFMKQSRYTHKTNMQNAKAKKQRFYYCSSSQNHSEVFNTEQTLTSQQVEDGP